MIDETAPQLNEIRETLRNEPLRIGISTRSLFNLEEEHSVFKNEGVQAYAALQRTREETLIDKGSGFEVVDRLLRLNERDEKPYVEVYLLSRNSPDLSLRAFNSIEKYGIGIKAGSFTSGRTLGPFISAWDLDLFLSNEIVDVKAAIEAGAAAAKLGIGPQSRQEDPGDEVRIAFDGDAVVFSAESDEIYKTQGLKAFLRHERENIKTPMSGGPFGKFLRKLSILRSIFMDDQGVSKVRIAIVTARNAPSHGRVVHTLRDWGTPADEAHFVGPRSKAPILKALGAHIFFDDQEKHVLGASPFVAAGHVPGPHDPEELIIPAG
jgi:5'-nucleotidase